MFYLFLNNIYLYDDDDIYGLTGIGCIGLNPAIILARQIIVHN